MAAGTDEFPEEKEAEELSLRLGEMGRLLREGRVRDVPAALLAAAFRGGRLTPTDEVPLGNSPRLEVFRARSLPTTLTLDGTTFGHELLALVEDFDSLETTEFLITAIEVTGRPDPEVRTTLRFDLSGTARGGGRTGRVGRWQMRWRRGPDAAWRVTRVDGARPPAEPRAGPRLRRSDGGGARRERLVPRAARARPRRLGGEPRRALHAAGHGAPRRVGRRLRRGRPGRRLRLAAGGAPQPPLPQQRRRHLHRRHRRGRRRRSRARRPSRSSPTWTTTATRTSSSSPARGRSCSSTTARAASRATTPRSSSSSGSKGLAHLGGARRLRPRRVPRPVPLHVRLLHRGERGQGRPSFAVPRRPERLGRTCSPRNDGHGRFVETTDEVGLDRTTTGSASPRRGPTTTRTAGPTSSWRTTSAARTSTTTRG